MNDTSPEREARYRAMLLERSGQERLKMGWAMRATARAFVEASIRAQRPGASPTAIRQGILLRFYGHEFDAATCADILSARNSHSVRRPARLCFCPTSLNCGRKRPFSSFAKWWMTSHLPRYHQRCGQRLNRSTP